MSPIATERAEQVVAALAVRWGAEPRPHGGKAVWAELDDRPTASP